VIGLLFNGQDDLQVLNNLRVTSSIGEYEFDRPKVYQLDYSNNIVQLPWLLSWDQTGADQAKFTGWDNYDHSQTLVVEVGKTGTQFSNYIQGLCWSAYIGGAESDYSFSITADLNNNKFITGSTISSDFPNFQGMFQYHTSDQLIFVTKFDSDEILKWSTYWGGSFDQEAYDIICRQNGDVCFCGYTMSTNFNWTANGNAFLDKSFNGGQDGFISCLNNAGNVRKWSTYLGSTGSDHVYCLAVDSSDNLFVVGDVGGIDSFPSNHTPSGSYSQAFNGNKDAFILKFNNADSLIWSTFYGGSDIDAARHVAVNSNGGVFIQGGTLSSNFPTLNPGTGGYIDSTAGGNYDDFILAFSNTGSRIWSSYFGGIDDEFVNGMGYNFSPGNKLAFNSQNKIYMVGSTESSNLDIKPETGFCDSTFASHDGYIAKFDGTDFSIEWCTYFSGIGKVDFNSVSINSNDHVYICGSTNDPDIFKKQNSGIYYQDTLYGFNFPYAMDGCIIAFDSYNNFIYGSYFGGNSSTEEIITSSCISNNSLYLTGYTSTDGLSGKEFPLFDPGQGAYADSSFNGGSKDAFVSEICIGSVINVSEISQNTNQLKIYPNPTSDIVIIEFNSYRLEKLFYRVFNCLGELLFVKPINSVYGKNYTEIDLTHLEQGVYYLSISNNNLNLATRFIKL
jgi:hypothetical protein